MIDPFINVPLNTKKVYVMGTTHSGCEIYLPIDSNINAVQLQARDNLRAYLLTQPKPPTITPPEPEPLRYA